MLQFEIIRDQLQAVEEEIEQWVTSPYPTLAQSTVHLLHAGGKRLRPALAIVAGHCAQYSINRVINLAAALELIHMATLVHDDVIDAALSRRGCPTVKALWGDKASLHTGDFLFGRSLLLIATYEDPRVAEVLAEVSVQMCQGEIQQMLTSYRLDQGVREYFYRIIRKTALLISASCQLGALVCNATAEVVESLRLYGYYLGTAFQITDDVLDYIARPEELGKPVGSDLGEGILTLPAIYALRQGNRSNLRNSLQEGWRQGDVTEAVELVRQGGGIEYSLQVARRYVDKAKLCLVGLEPGFGQEALLACADFVLDRHF